MGDSSNSSILKVIQKVTKVKKNKKTIGVLWYSNRDFLYQNVDHQKVDQNRSQILLLSYFVLLQVSLQNP